MAGKGGAVGRHVQKHGAPTGHAGLRPFFEVVGHDVVDLHLALEAFLVFVRNGLRVLHLLAGRQQVSAIHLGPAVILRVRQLDVIGLQLLGHLQDLLGLIDVLAVQHDVHHHRVVVVLDQPRHGQFALEGLGAPDVVVQFGRVGLKAQLDMIQTGFLQSRNARLVHTDAGSDQVGVIAELPGFPRQVHEVLAHQGLATRETELRGAHRTAFTEHPQPLLGGKLILILCVVSRVRTIEALQRAAVGQLCQQPQRVIRLAVRH